MDMRDDPLQRMRPGRITGGPLIESAEDRETIPISAGLLLRNNIHVLQVKGDSMIGDFVLDGDHVIVESRNVARDGEMVIALLKNSETILKRFRRDGRQIRLEQTDASDEAMVFDEKDVAKMSTDSI